MARQFAAREQAEPAFAWKRERARLEEENRVLEARIAKLGDSGERAQETAPEESPRSEFTMGVMLRSLNIDLSVIGYDAVHEAWR
ncbi:unnamed protein product [Parascedosporium putredinis]|uniref:Uncharacterized protein n=1 Tax=Parascedosporium putredinis TaxID=1442378 RepID=A0A9P1HCQ8_9PEZI|nr:unnamed protein product [Parascedosporium putredinis]CAI8003288.1 unnamed protein product [Parascedosporium putredinis]